MTFMILILEDRAVTNIEKLLSRIQKSEIGKKEEVKKCCKMLMQNKTNPAKMGVIGQYVHYRSKMLTEDEMIDFADVCETYDKVVLIQERIIRKMVRLKCEELLNLDEEQIAIVADIVMSIVCADMVELYYKIYREKPDFIQPMMRGIKFTDRYFKAATSILDNLSFEIIGKLFSFNDWPEFDKTYIAYINTIINNKRMMEHYKKMGIKENISVNSVSNMYRVSVKYDNKSV